ncbi:hypothetical protein [Sinimarinibacterium flocculans]|uniref:hypothetical protein n=1 Tax=Sinimarinibacterium flocculans TaxID=985250 RepID=UPI0024907AC8|nr:hypothetical protein [Sinimarinibacterium flocculans]
MTESVKPLSADRIEGKHYYAEIKTPRDGFHYQFVAVICRNDGAEIQTVRSLFSELPQHTKELESHIAQLDAQAEYFIREAAEGERRRIDGLAESLAEGDAFMAVQDFDMLGQPVDAWRIHERNFNGADEVWTSMHREDANTFVAALEVAAKSLNKEQKDD